MLLINNVPHRKINRHDQWSRGNFKDTDSTTAVVATTLQQPVVITSRTSRNGLNHIQALYLAFNMARERRDINTNAFCYQRLTYHSISHGSREQPAVEGCRRSVRVWKWDLHRDGGVMGLRQGQRLQGNRHVTADWQGRWNKPVHFLKPSRKAMWEPTFSLKLTVS